MKVYTLSLFLPQLPQALRLTYSSEERARQAFHQTFDFTGALTLSDDFGAQLMLIHPPVARVLCDVSEELNGNVEISLLQGRAQMKAQQRAKSDPTLSNSGSIIPIRGN